MDTTTGTTTGTTWAAIARRESAARAAEREAVLVAEAAILTSLQTIEAAAWERSNVLLATGCPTCYEAANEAANKATANVRKFRLGFTR